MRSLGGGLDKKCSVGMAFVWDQGDGDLFLGKLCERSHHASASVDSSGEKVPPETLNWKETGARTDLRFKFPLPGQVPQP